MMWSREKHLYWKIRRGVSISPSKELLVHRKAPPCFYSFLMNIGDNRPGGFWRRSRLQVFVAEYSELFLIAKSQQKRVVRDRSTSSRVRRDVCVPWSLCDSLIKVSRVVGEISNSAVFLIARSSRSTILLKYPDPDLSGRSLSFSAQFDSCIVQERPHHFFTTSIVQERRRNSIVFLVCPRTST